MSAHALARAFPAAFARVPWAELGEWPTAVEPLDGVAAEIGVGRGELWVKREDQSGLLYGGNKVRSLEPLVGEAQAAGANRIYATGAFGSNQALATVLHAGRLGMETGAILFPQPRTKTALANLMALLSARPRVRALPHWSWLPFAMAAERRRAVRDGARPVVLPPGGATPVGALGYVSAALELVEQVEAGACPLPRRIYVGVGSVATSAGLLVGLRMAARLGRIQWTPQVIGVRVTPWPVTGAFRIVGLAARAAALIDGLLGDQSAARMSKRELASGLRVVGRQLGKGYGFATAAGEAAIATSARGGGPPLDVCYSGKVMAGVIDEMKAGLAEGGPVLFWSSKSSQALPPVDEAAIEAAPMRMQRWIGRARKELALPAGVRAELPPHA